MKLIVALATLSIASARQLEAWSYSYEVEEADAIEYSTSYSTSYSYADGVSTSYSYSYETSYVIPGDNYFSYSYTNACVTSADCEADAEGEAQFCTEGETCDHCGVCCDDPSLEITGECPEACACPVPSTSAPSAAPAETTAPSAAPAPAETGAPSAAPEDHDDEHDHDDDVETVEMTISGKFSFDNLDENVEITADVEADIAAGIAAALPDVEASAVRIISAKWVEDRRFTRFDKRRSLAEGHWEIEFEITISVPVDESSGYEETVKEYFAEAIEDGSLVQEIAEAAEASGSDVNIWSDITIDADSVDVEAEVEVDQGDDDEEAVDGGASVVGVGITAFVSAAAGIYLA